MDHEQLQRTEETQELTANPQEDARALLIQRLQEVGKLADMVARERVFMRYKRGKADNTTRRRHSDLKRFAAYLAEGNVPLAAPLDTEEGKWQWEYITYGLVEGFKEWLIWKGYTKATINASLSTVKVYAQKASDATILPRDQYLAIKGVDGLREKEADRIDEEREQNETPTRVGDKKSEPTYLSPFLLERLFARPDTSKPQGWRDLVLLRLLYDLGPRPGELVTLRLEDLDREKWRIHVKRHKSKTKKEQYLALNRETIIALQGYLNVRIDHDPKAPLLVQTTRYGQLVEQVPRSGGGVHTPFWSVRNVSRRVHDLGIGLVDEGGKKLDIDLCAYDARHNWTREVFDDVNQNNLPDILEAGGWTSNSGVWRRYYGKKTVANANIRLNRKIKQEE